MRKNRLFLLLILILLLTQTASSQVFFRQHWAEFDKITNNNPHDTRWRVNDAELSLHPTFGRRTEARINGLMLLNVPEDLFGLERAELYLELWGGHPLTENKRFILNGKGTYFLPDDGTEEENCAYTYPLVPVNIEHLVSGLNAFQFACDRGKTFWGHFIIDNASVRCYLKPDHPDLLKNNLQDFTACVTPANPDALGANVALSLSVAEEYVPQIVSVDYFARFSGFADNGLLTENSWHGFTQGREFKNHVGRSVTAPFKVNWDTRMIPDQSKSMAVRALVTLNSGIKYRTPVTDGLIFPRNRPRVMLFYCTDLP
ncbi:hypothetical protein JW935_01360, partial [candidate division KSB1 bacterium]|nr:hypothetical protein [candidate division KSB1 bacterium]